MSEQHPTHVILVPGFWLGAWAWDRVIAHLPADRLTPHPITPLGLDRRGEPGAAPITLVDRIEDVVAVVDELTAITPGRMVLVGHSGGGAVVQGVVDRRPTSIDRVIYVDAGPLLDGTAMASITVEPPVDADVVPLPPWDVWQEAAGALEGLDEPILDEFRRRAVPEPAGVPRSVIALDDAARLNVPATVICTSIPSDRLRELVAAGQLPSEITDVKEVTWIDLPTGHWPMFSRPADLAAFIASEASRPMLE